MNKFNWNGAATCVQLLEGDPSIAGPISGNGYTVSRSAEGYCIDFTRGEFDPDVPAGTGESAAAEPAPVVESQAPDLSTEGAAGESVKTETAKQSGQESGKPAPESTGTPPADTGATATG